MRSNSASMVLRFRNALGFATLVTGVVALAGAYGSYPNAAAVAPGRVQQPPISPQEHADCSPSGTTRSARDRRTGALRSIGTSPGRPIIHPVRLQASRSSAAAARSYLSFCGRLFGLQDANAELDLIGTARPGPRRSVVRFRQMHQGVPIVGGELVVHLDASNNIVTVGGKTLPDVIVQTIPAVAEAAAREQALNTVADAQRVDRSLLISSTPELSIYDPALIGPGTGEPRLVWRVEVTPLELLPIREMVLVDALLGSVVLHFNQVESALNRRTYTALNQETLPGSLVCNESNPSCAGGDSHAVGAHRSAADTYNFYLSTHGRDGIDNAGMTITSTVHYSASFNNAFWDGLQMVFGDGAGFPLADDLVAHEFTHGVTQHTSNLFYYYQSGAINESFSDIWGELVDQTNGRGNDSASVRWLMGEDIAGQGALRSMSNPTAFGDPDRMTSSNYYRFAGDNGGVHTNSGINNKAAYLMVDGGSFNGQTITALGVTKVARIYYEVQTQLLTSGSDYADLYEALFQGCNNLVGTSGITSFDCQQVRNATNAVEMSLQPTPGFNPDGPVCPAHKTPSDLFFDDLEPGSGNWQFAALSGTSRFSYDFLFAHSGSHALYADDFSGDVSDSYAGMATGVTLPPAAFLHFAHAFALGQPNPDGGVVEYSTNGGTSWSDAWALFDANGYTGTLGGSGNPLAGRSGFVGDSHGYISSRLNLASLAGQTVRFRWRMGSDSNQSSQGWWLDDVRIYTCVDPVITAAPAAVSQGGAVTVNVTNDPGGSRDWVGLYPTSAVDGGFIDWLYLNDSKTPPTSGTTTATLHFMAPATPGPYEFRLFVNGFTRIATSATVTVQTVPTLTINDASVTEGTSGITPTVFTVTLAPTSADPVTVNYATANNTAAAGSDYTSVSGMLTFAPGISRQTINVDVNGDGTVELNEAFWVKLSSAVGAPIGRSQGVGTIVNDDFPPAPAVTVSPASVNGGDPLTVTVANGPANVNDWVGFFPTAAADGGFIAWAYLSDTHTMPITGTAGATLHFTAPMTPGTYNFRFFAGGYNRIATSTTVTVAPPLPPALTVSAATVNTGNSITVTLTNGPANRNDWVAFYPSEATDSAYIAWAYLSDTHTLPVTATSSAALHFTAPMTPGTYNFRLFMNGFTRIATSATVTVLAVPTLSINDVSVTEGQNGTTHAIFTVTLAPTSTGTVTVGYATTATGSPTGSATAGSDYTGVSNVLTFPPGIATETIAVGINGDLTVEPNESFVINLTGASGAAIGRAQGLGTIVNDDIPPAPTVSASAGTFNGGQMMTVTVANGPANTNDWVGFFSTAALDSGFLQWAYLSDSHTRPVSGMAAATLHFTAPVTPGTYNFRLFANGFTKLATSVTFTVLAAPAPPGPTVTASAGMVNGVEMMTVTVANGPANRNDWVGLFPIAAPDSGFVAWAFLSGTHALPGSGMSSATLNFVAPMTPGAYNVRLFANGFTRLATSAMITVTGGTARVIFTASTEHAIVTSYLLQVFPSDADPDNSLSIASTDLGTPAPDGNREIAVDKTAFFSALAQGSYIVTVAAIGGDGFARSAPVAFTR